MKIETCTAFGRRRGFTMLELVVCIGVLAILASFVMGQFSKAMGSARNASCLANMRQLSIAYGNSKTGYAYWLRAGGVVVYNTEMGTAEYQYSPGWISWYAKWNYTSSLSPLELENMSTYYNASSKEEYEKRLDCLKHGGEISDGTGRMWKSMKHNQSGYLCPLHTRAAEKQSGGRLRPMWSYVLNGWFNWEMDATPVVGGSAINSLKGRKGLPNYRPQDMVMNFAEIQMEPLKINSDGTTITPLVSDEFDLRVDHILQYKGNAIGEHDAEIDLSTGGSETADSLTDGGEVIGFNHAIGNKKVAHVAFVDGHVEQLSLPENATLDNLRDLTIWLCYGKCFTLEGNLYREDELD